MLPQRRRAVRLLSRGLRAARRLSLRLDDVARRADGHDRGRRGRVRESSWACSCRRSRRGRSSPSGRSRVSAVQAVAIAVIVVLTASNATGVKTGTRTQNVFTVAKFAALLALTARGPSSGRRRRAWRCAARASGMPRRSSGRALTGAPLALALGTAMVGPLFSQSAWNNVTFAGEEIRDPGRTLPRALLVGLRRSSRCSTSLANVAYLNVLPLSESSMLPRTASATAVADAPSSVRRRPRRWRRRSWSRPSGASTA